MKKTVSFLALSILFLLFCVSCASHSVMKPSGVWESEDHKLTLDFDTLRGTLTQEGLTETFDILYSYSLKQIAFYSNQKEIFIGTFLLEDGCLTVTDESGMLCFHLLPKDKDKR